MKRITIILIVALAVACSRKAPEVHKRADADVTRSPDAGQSVLDLPIPSNAPPALRSFLEHQKARRDQPKPKPLAQQPPDPRIVACTKSATDKASLMACLSGATRTGAGTHKIGATRPLPNCPALAVPEWDFSPSGSDDNTCVDPGHPCATFAEVQSRYGCGAGPVTTLSLGGTNVHWYVHGDMPLSSKFSIDIRESSGGTFGITCDTTTVATGTLSGVVAKTHPHGAGQPLNVNLGAFTNSYVGLQLVNSTRNAVAWVDSLVFGSTTVALITQPFTTLTGFLVDTFANGDAYTIQQPYKIYVHDASVKWGNPQRQLLFPQYGGGYPTFTNCWIANDPAAAPYGDILHVQDVDFMQTRVDNAMIPTHPRLTNSIVTTTPQNYTTGLVLVGGAMTGGPPGWDTADGIFLSSASPDVGNFITSDAIIHGNITFNSASVVSIGAMYLDGVDHNPAGAGGKIWNNGATAPFPGSFTSPQIYGLGVIQNWIQGWWGWEDSNTTPGTEAAFGSGITVNTSDGDVMVAADYSHTPIQYQLCPLSVAALYLPYSSCGFQGLATSEDSNTQFYNWSRPLPGTPTTLVWGGVNGGLGVAGCPLGQIAVATAAGGNFVCDAVGGDLTLPSSNLSVASFDVVGLRQHAILDRIPYDAQFYQWQTRAWDPSLLGSANVAWYRADTAITIDGPVGVGNVSEWDDQTPNGFNLTNATGVARPHYSAFGGANNKPYLYGNADRYLTNASFTQLTHPFTMLFVLRSTTASPISTSTISSMATGTKNEAYQAGATNQLREFNGVEVNNTAFTANVDHAVRFEWNNASSCISLDGAASTCGDPGSPTDATATGIGIMATAAGNTPFAGWLYEAEFVNRILTGPEYQNWLGYVHANYGITVTGGTTPSAGSVWAPISFSQDLSIVDNGAATVLGALAKPFPVLPGSDKYLHYTGSAWAFDPLSAGVTVAAGTGINVTGGPAYTVALATPVAIASLAGCGVNNQILQTVGGVQTCETVSGDITLAAGVATLASVGAAGSCGDTTHSCSLVFDAKGRETSDSNNAIAFPVTSVAGAGSTTCSPTTGAVVCTTANSVNNGLTGATTLTSHGVLVGEGTSAVAATTAGALNTLLQGKGAADPAFSTWTFPAPGPAGDAVISDGTNWGSGYPPVGSKNTQLGHTNKIVKYFRTTTNTANQVAYTYPLPSGAGNMAGLTITTVGKDVTTAGNFIAYNQLTAVYWNNAGVATRFIGSTGDTVVFNQNGPAPTTNASGFLSIQILISPLTSDTMDWAFYVDAFEN